jgi:hypothetical protein
MTVQTNGCPFPAGARSPLSFAAARNKLPKPFPLVVPQQIDIPNHQTERKRPLRPTALWN